MDKVKLHVLGRPTNVIISKFKSVLDSGDIHGDGIILFCDYSNYDVPIGYSFNMIKEIDGNIIYTGPVILKKVTQEFLKSYDCIPKGHKTICLFEVLDNDLKEILNLIPPINDWYNSQGFLIFE